MIIYGIVSILFFFVDTCYTCLWTNTFGFFPPIPFGAYTVWTVCIPVVFFMMWFRIPKSARKEKELQRRFVIFLVSRAYDLSVAFVYVFFTLLFIHIPSDYQPILGFVCPLLRFFFLKIFNFITYRAGGGRIVKMGMFFHNQIRFYCRLGPICIYVLYLGSILTISMEFDKNFSNWS